MTAVRVPREMRYIYKTEVLTEFDSILTPQSPIPRAFMDDVFGNCLLFAEGQEWKRLRGILSPIFTAARLREKAVLINKSSHKGTCCSIDSGHSHRSLRCRRRCRDLCCGCCCCSGFIIVIVILVVVVVIHLIVVVVIDVVIVMVIVVIIIVAFRKRVTSYCNSRVRLLHLSRQFVPFGSVPPVSACFSFGICFLSLWSDKTCLQDSRGF